MGESWADAHLGRDDPVVRVPLGDVGLGAWRGLPVAHIHRPAVHPVLLPGTLWEGNSRWCGRGPGLKVFPRLALMLVSVGAREGWTPLQG